MTSLNLASPIWPDLYDAPPQGDPGYWRFFTALLGGRLNLGQTLTQDHLCDVLGMSLSPLRETMTLLSAEGLIEIRKRVGVTVFYPDVAFVRTHFQFRGMIEREALRKFAGNVTEQWLDLMETAHREAMSEVATSHRSSDYEQMMRLLEQNLHGRFVAAFDNPYITDVHGKLFRKLYLLRLLYPVGANKKSTIRSLEEHLEILAHLRRRDGDAAAACLEQHLSGVFHRTLGI